MKRNIQLLAAALLALLPFTSLHAQEPAAKDAGASKRTDVYHVFFAKCAPGKAKELADFMKEPDPKAPMPDHRVILRHQDGDDWDYVEIEHLGTKATIENGGSPMPASKRTLIEWHNDTYASGPAWDEFAKAMGLGGDAAKGSPGVYVVSDYRAVPGHRDDLEKRLTAPTTGDTSTGNVLLQHLEGASWNFLGVVRYDSWEKYAEAQKVSVAQSGRNQDGWFQLRNDVACHHDTLSDRILP